MHKILKFKHRRANTTKERNLRVRHSTDRSESFDRQNKYNYNIAYWASLGTLHNHDGDGNEIVTKGLIPHTSQVAHQAGA